MQEGETRLSAFIADFGKNKDGLNLYRINGSENEIMNAVEKLKEIGCEICDEIELERSFRSYTVLLKVHVPMSNERKGNQNENS